MGKWITKKQLLEIARSRKYGNEDDFREYMAKKLEILFEVKGSQISREPITTSFDYTLENRADIAIRTDDNFQKALVIIELKLAKKIEKDYGGNYERPVKQLHKYCQDTRAPYGILLTEEVCFVFKNRYFAYNQEPRRDEEDRLPPIEKIEDTLALYALLDFVLHPKSAKYLLLLLTAFFFFEHLIKFVSVNYGIWFSWVVSFTIVSVTTFVLYILAKVFKIFE